MFSLRVHSVDFAAGAGNDGADSFSDSISTLHIQSPQADAAEASSSSSLAASGTDSFTSGTKAAVASRNPNPKIHLTHGVVHLYRSSSYAAVASASASASSSAAGSQLSPSDSLLPPWRGKLLYVLAVPSRITVEEFLRFCDLKVDSAAEIRIIQNELIEDRYSVLISFDEQRSTDELYYYINGWRFPSSKGEVCHVLFLVSVQYTQSTEMAAALPVGSVELPTCPVCIERLDQDITGITATSCDHSFHCSCGSLWANSSCPVCHFCQKPSEKPRCSICETFENLWICVICGFIGCGRYKEGHAIRHWKETHHCFSLDLETQRVWDYVGDSYVHRLNHSKGDEKLAKLKTKCKYTGDTCACGDESEISRAIVRSRIEAIEEEYNHLLVSQLETQRHYYETLLAEARGGKENYISDAVDKVVTAKLHEMQLQLESLMKEAKEVAQRNDNLMKTQDVWRQTLKEMEEREKSALLAKDEMIRDLEEQIRDFTVSIEAQKVINRMGDADDIKGGALLPVPALESNAAKNKRSSRMGKKRSQ